MSKKVLVFLSLAALLAGCEDYGDKVSKGHVDIYYKEGIQKEGAEKTAELIHSIDVAAHNDTTKSKSMQLAIEQDTITFRMVVTKEDAARVGDESFLVMANLLSQDVFNNKPVNIDLTDDHFDPERTLHFKKVSLD